MIVVGAGAAGTMAAIFAARTGAEVLLLERTTDGGRKILISGGGRCNILPSTLDESRFVTDSSANTLRKMVRSWPLQEQIAFFERDCGLPLIEEPASAKLFPASDRARDVRDRLYDLARASGATIRAGANLASLDRIETEWQVRLDGGEVLVADAVIMATGGLSVPQTGSDGRGLAVVRSLGHTVHQTYPALTPLTASPPPFGELAGISLEVTLAARTESRKATATGGFLFTHRGYSGPAVLDISHVAVRSRLDHGSPAIVTARWTPLGEDDWNATLQAAGVRTVLAVVTRHMPGRLAESLIRHAGVDPGTALSNLTRTERLKVVDALVRFSLPWNGDEGYRKAEVTGGGVSLSEVDPRSLESRICKGLFICGEMLDAFGPIGGYNFLWAWATGRAAGLGAGGKV